jgi:S-adenosylmethionine:tRNA ribosyltransferase-isomerase
LSDSVRFTDFSRVSFNELPRDLLARRSRVMQWEFCPEECVEEEEPQRPFRRDTYHYVLPAHLIAQHPLPRRDESRLMVLFRESGAMHHSTFRNLRDHLRRGDLLVVNDSKVFPARLIGSKPSGGRADLLLLKPCEEGGPGSHVWECLIRCAGRPRKGQALAFPCGLQGKVAGHSEDGVWKVHFDLEPEEMHAYLEAHGRVPLPPYIKRGCDEGPAGDRSGDRVRYQTVFAEHVGSVAAPTAGFHFTEELLRSLEEGGVSFAKVTLHVGQATFLPIRARDVRRHRIGPERYRLSEENAEKIRQAKREGRRLVAVGTTVVRCLESLVSEKGRIEAGEGWANLYILPGHRFEVVDALITNFHLPGTSLLVLVCAFASLENVFNAYEEAVRRDYRFFSYGDCMLVQ